MNLKKSLTAWKQKQDKMDLPQRLLEENLEDGLYILLHYFANNIFVYLWVRTVTILNKQHQIQITDTNRNEKAK